MKESTWKSKFEILIGGFILLLLWQAIAVKVNNDIYLPKLQEVLTSLFQIVKEKDFLLIVFSSFYRTIISFGVALIFAIIMGVLSSLYPLINNLLKPLNSIGKTIPTDRKSVV